MSRENALKKEIWERIKDDPAGIIAVGAVIRAILQRRAMPEDSLTAYIHQQPRNVVGEAICLVEDAESPRFIRPEILARAALFIKDSAALGEAAAWQI